MDEKIEEMFREIMDWEADCDVTDDMSVKTVEDWDSLVSMQMIMSLEKTFHLKFSYDEILGMDSIGNIKKMVKSKNDENC